MISVVESWLQMWFCFGFLVDFHFLYFDCVGKWAYNFISLCKTRSSMCIWTYAQEEEKAAEIGEAKIEIEQMWFRGGQISSRWSVSQPLRALHHYYSLMKFKQIELALFTLSFSLLMTTLGDIRQHSSKLSLPLCVRTLKWISQNIMNENKIIIEIAEKKTTKITIIVIRTKSSAKARPQILKNSPFVHPTTHIKKKTLFHDLSFSFFLFFFFAEWSYGCSAHIHFVNLVYTFFPQNVRKKHASFYDPFGRREMWSVNENSPKMKKSNTNSESV